MDIQLINSETAENDIFKMYEGFGYPMYTHKPSGKTYNIHTCPPELLEETRAFLKAVTAARAEKKANFEAAEKIRIDAWSKSVKGIEDEDAIRRHEELMDEMDRPDSYL